MSTQGEDRPLLGNYHAPWWKRPSPYLLYPVFLLHILAQSTLMGAQPGLFENLSCKIQYDLDMGIRDPRCHDPTIQQKLYKYSVAVNLIAGLLAVWVVPRIMSVSDRYGRKIPLGYAMACNLVALITAVLAQTYRKHVKQGFLTTPFIILGLGGTDALVVASLSAYIADCTDPDKRTRHVSMLMSVGFVSVVVSQVTSNLDNTLAPVYIATGLELVAGVIVLAIPESLSRRRMFKHQLEFENARRQQLSWKRAVWDRVNLAEPLEVVRKLARSQGRTLWHSILALVVVDFCYYAALNLREEPTFLNSQLYLKWSVDEMGSIRTLTCVGRAIVLAIAIPIALKTLKEMHQEMHTDGMTRAEISLVKFGLCIEIIVSIAAALSQNTVQNYAIGLVECLGVISKPTIQAAFLNLIPRAHLGSFLGAIGAITVIASMGGSSLGSVMYSWMGVGVFYLASVTFLLGLLSSLALRPYVGPYDDNDDWPEERGV